MKRIAIITLTASIALAAAAAAARKNPSGKGPEDAVGELRQQIAAKVLYDGLQLTPDQKARLAAKLAEMDAAKDARATTKDARSTELEAALRTARDEVYQTGTITAATRDRLQQIHREAKEAKKARKDARSEKKPGGELETILTPQQIDYFKTFDARRELGLVPERDGAKAAGKAGKGPVAERVAERVRAMSDDEFQQHKQKMLEKSRERMTERGVSDVDAKVQKLGTQIDTLRTGTPAELAALEADHALALMLGQHAQKGSRERHRKEERREKLKILTSPAFRALLDGKDPLQAK